MRTVIKRSVFPMVTCFLITGHALAAVTMVQDITVDGGGALKMLSSEGTVTTSISGNKSRTDNNIESKSSMLRKFAKNMDASTILLLDKERLVNLYHEKQQYSEMSLDQMKQQLDQSMEKMEESGQAQAGLPVSEDECEWSEPVMEVKHTKVKQKFANVKAEQHFITASQTCTVPETGKSCEMKWNLEYWNAKRMPGYKEATAFQENLALKLGGDEMLAMAQASSRGVLAMFKEGWGDVLNETDDMKGFAVKTVMSMEIGGEGCTTPAGQQIGQTDIWGDAADAGLNAATSSAASHAGSRVGYEASKAAGHSVGGRIAGSAVGAASREVVSGMFKKFGKKKKKKQEPAPATAQTEVSANPASGSVILFTITSVLTSVNQDDIPAARFEAPVNWKKVKASGF